MFVTRCALQQPSQAQLFLRFALTAWRCFAAGCACACSQAQVLLRGVHAAVWRSSDSARSMSCSACATRSSSRSIFSISFFRCVSLSVFSISCFCVRWLRCFLVHGATALGLQRPLLCSRRRREALLVLRTLMSCSACATRASLRSTSSISFSGASRMMTAENR